MSRRMRVALALVVLPPILAACDLLMTEPAPPAPEVSVAFTMEDAGSSPVADVFDKVRFVHLTFTKSDSSRRDTTVRVTPRNGQAAVRLSLESKERIPALLVQAQLGIAAGALFHGQRVIRINLGEPTSAEIPILPVPFRVRADRAQLALASVGDTARLGSVVQFATGDSIPGWPRSWTSENPEIVFVTANGLSQARAVGETRLFVRSGELLDTVLARVQSGR